MAEADKKALAKKTSKNTVKSVSGRKTELKAAPVKAETKTAVKKTAVKKAAPVKAETKTVVKKAAPVKAETKTAVKKAAPVKAETKTVVKKAAPVKAETKTAVKKTAVKKAAPVKAEVKKTVKKETPAPKAEPVKKAVRKREESLKKLRLSKADKKFFYDLLIHTRASFGQQIQFHSEDALSSRRDSAGERAGMATHMADLGTDNYRHDFELGLMSEEVDVLEMIDEALQRLEDSEYGICLDCGEQIPRKRLEAKPYAKYCVKCKSRREQMDDQYHRR